jgi:sugar phosphate isomerase/epimerase
MRVYASTACLNGRRSLWEILDKFESAGLDAVELGSSRLDAPDGLVDRLARRRVAYAVHNYFPPPRTPFVLNLGSADATIAARSAAFVASSLDLAAQIRAPFYGVHGGFAVDAVDVGPAGLSLPDAPPARTAREAARRYEERIAPLADRARELEVALLVENNVCIPDNRGKVLHQSAEELEELIAAVPGVGLLVDTGHLNVTATTFGFDREAFVHTLAPHIGAFHVHDNDGLVDQHRPAAPDSWILPLVRSVGAPLVVEARFPDVAALADHVRRMEQQTE